VWRSHRLVIYMTGLLGLTALGSLQLPWLPSARATDAPTRVQLMMSMVQPIVPTIEELAARQHVAMNLMAPSWPLVVERLGGDFLSGTCVQVAPSLTHGLGVFATEDIPAGELVTLYPCHRVLQTTEKGKIVGAMADDEVDAAYFVPPRGSVSPEDAEARQTTYSQAYAHVNPQRQARFNLDANPSRPDVPGWLGHRINDGATVERGIEDLGLPAQVMKYYEESAATRNCCAVALPVPLIGFVTTKAVPSGSELLCTYGHSYWLKTAAKRDAIEMALADTLVGEAFAAQAREADLFQVATDKKYSRQLSALESFIEAASADFV